MDYKIDKEELKYITFSDGFKRKMNRLFRETVGTNKIPHPDVDNLYEYIRSNIIRITKFAVKLFEKRTK